MDINNLHSTYIAGKIITENYNKYRLNCKVGSYCIFGYEQITNQKHSHDSYELCIIVSGSGSFIYNKEEYKIKEGDIIIAEPYVKHEIQAGFKEDLVLLYIFIEIELAGRRSFNFSIEDKYIERFLNGHSNKSSQIRLLAYLSFIEEYNSEKKKFHHGTCEALKNLILDSLEAFSDSSEINEVTGVKNIIENSLDYIDSNLHRKMLVKDVAESSFTTVRNLEYLFKKHLNKTVIGYINEKKVELACHYLSMNFSISDTADMIGIKNTSHFSVLFKKHKDITPQKYKKENANYMNGMGRRL